MKTSKSFSNAELQVQFGELLSTGAVVCVAHRPSSKEGSVRIELIQQRSVASPFRTRMSQFMKSISSGSLPIVRAWHTVTKRDAKQFVIGKPLDHLRLVIVDSLYPQYDTHSPRVTSEGNLLVDSDGNMIYRDVITATKEEQYDDLIIHAYDSGEQYESQV